MFEKTKEIQVETAGIAPIFSRFSGFHKTKGFQLGLAFLLALTVVMLPRPEGSRFRVVGDENREFFSRINRDYEIVPMQGKTIGYEVTVKEKNGVSPGLRLLQQAEALGTDNVRIEYIDGLSPTAMRFLAVLAALIFLFILEPIPLEITAICIGVFLVLTGITDVKTAWAAYMHPVVVFVMCCLIFAISLDKVGLTTRLGHFITKKAGTSVVRFTFILSIGLGICSAFMHDAAACAIGIVTMLPMMRAAGIEPNSNTARFMMLSLPFATSCGGMGSLVGGGRCMVSAAFLKEFTGMELSFLDWMLYAFPAALLTVPAAVFVIYLLYRPDPRYRLPEYDEKISPWSAGEKKTMIIIGISLLLWLTKEIHGYHYSITGMLGVAALVVFGILKWEDIHNNLEWGTALFIFGGGLSLGLAMEFSGAGNYFASLFFPMVKGGGWLLLFIGVGVFGALVTNAMANVAAAALIMPIVIPIARLEGVDPRVIALCLGMATSFAMLLVIGCPPNAIAYSYRYFKSSDLTKAGAVATPVLLGILVLVAGVWWKILGLV
ncbi:MAG: DASS family sodium-coupled anion symporter [Desulfobacteraceae bacterium]|nr:MAG: DASS family sodium-coupled anion symporter [Desulfobacteraceae bacterium]